MVILMGALIAGCAPQPPIVDEDEIIRKKAAQLVQAERNNFTSNDATTYNLGSVLSGGGSRPANNSVSSWRDMVENYQNSSTTPIIYGIDAVHGHNNLLGATIFPHNIGLGAANDEDLVRRIGIATGKEVSATGIHWNFAPTLAVVQDIRWGRTYESYSENPQLVSKLGAAYIQGLQSVGLAATAKHFVADGGAVFGTGSGNYLIDQGDTQLEEAELRKIHLYPYLAAINEADVLTVMISYSSINGKKMHASKYWITDVLKEELGFKGLVISDWEAIHQLPGSLYLQVVASINAGVDMLMQPANWKDTTDALVRAVKNKDISMERFNDAYNRVMYVKEKLGILDGTFTRQDESVIYSTEHQELAREAVSKSLVLLKNDNDVLPLKKDAKILLIGPGADNAGFASGGWTFSWQGETNNTNLPQATTLKEAFEAVANEYGGMITTDISRVNEVDLVILALAETSYSEGFGDANDLSLNGSLMATGNKEAINIAKLSKKPVVTILTAGRPRLIHEELKDWDAMVMAWLYGSEAAGITDVLYGDVNFTGKLPFSWPKSSNTGTTSSLNTNRDNTDILFDFGYGLEYK
ncbi:MAG: glycoside hydrolase family 3 protein [Erysipelothrix sp.]|jgi:beta-glucosidase|nr:glycoside hydrolase family 3 protein [Erysipelothrix sp.]